MLARGVGGRQSCTFTALADQAVTVTFAPAPLKVATDIVQFDCRFDPPRIDYLRANGVSAPESLGTRGSGAAIDVSAHAPSMSIVDRTEIWESFSGTCSTQPGGAGTQSGLAWSHQTTAIWQTSASVSWHAPSCPNGYPYGTGNGTLHVTATNGDQSTTGGTITYGWSIGG